MNETSEFLRQHFFKNYLPFYSHGFRGVFRWQFGRILNRGFESFYVSIGIVRNAFFPASEQNADPFKGQSPHGNVVTLASGDLGLIVGLSPGAETDRVSSELVKRLPLKLRAGPSEVDAEALAAGDADGGNAGQIQQVADAFETVTIRSEGRQQSWASAGPAPGQLSKRKRSG
jgi:hypothetical protein